MNINEISICGKLFWDPVSLDDERLVNAYATFNMLSHRVGADATYVEILRKELLKRLSK